MGVTSVTKLFHIIISIFLGNINIICPPISEILPTPLIRYNVIQSSLRTMDIMFNDTRNAYNYIIDVELVIIKQNITLSSCMNHDTKLYTSTSSDHCQLLNKVVTHGCLSCCSMLYICNLSTLEATDKATSPSPLYYYKLVCHIFQSS